MGRKNIQNPTDWSMAALKNDYQEEEGGGRFCAVAVNFKKFKGKRKREDVDNLDLSEPLLKVRKSY